MKLTNVTAGAHARVQFREVGLFGRERNVVQGSVFGKNGEKLIPFTGRWSESLQRQVDSDTLSVVWKAHALPATAKDYYGFTRFAAQLNEITPVEAGRLCGTDSRLRKDIRMLEEGNMEGAEEEKQRLEEAQRVARRIREERGENYNPKWFAQDVDPATNITYWKYKGGYWESRKQPPSSWASPLF
jgi:5-oxoprolinase (ATP-hydrolysing)